MTQSLAPKPVPREGRASFLRHLRLFRDDILSAQPARLYRAWMAEFRAPFLRSVLANDPAIVREVLQRRPSDFAKSSRIIAGLRPLLGRAVFVANGAEWEAQRRLIDPAFSDLRLAAAWPAILRAGEDAVWRVRPGPFDAEEWASHACADAIFRVLFSVPIADPVAAETYAAFREYQRAQPVASLAALLPLPRWLPRPGPIGSRRAALRLRRLIANLVHKRAEEIAAGEAPDDLATRLMTAEDPETGRKFTREEMIDQVSIFFLAGHETSAAVLAWALWLLAAHPDYGARAAAEARNLPDEPGPGRLSAVPFIRDTVRETLRLYPPVPMLVRETVRRESFRNRLFLKGTQVIVSPWHLHRHERFWPDPDRFMPERWGCPGGRAPARDAYLPFSAGPRVCPGAGFAMAEITLFLALLLRDWRPVPAGSPPVPVAHLTVRSKDGIHLLLRPRE